MNGRHLTDAQISTALRARLPERADAALRQRILDAAATTPQQRPLPSFLAGLTDADPGIRRRNLLLAAALLIGLSLAVAAGVGAWLESQKRDDPFSLAPPPDVNLYVAGSFEGLGSLPPLEFTVMPVDGPKGRWYFNGDGVVRADHFARDTDEEPMQIRILSGTEAAERGNLNGRSVWVRTLQQPSALSELAFATGFNPTCATDWDYVGLEYVIDRPVHHVACDGSALWMDVETHLPLRAIIVQGGDLPTYEVNVIELTVGPQPAELFEPPPGLVTITDAEYRCATDPACESPAPPAPARPPLITPPPAPGEFAQPQNADAFVADVVAKYATLPPLELTVKSAYGGEAIRVRYLYDGTDRSRMERYYLPDTPPTVYLWIGGHVYESYGNTDDGRSLWADRVEPFLAVNDFGISRRCLTGWEHRGFDLVVGRPAHHLACGRDEYWVDREWLLAVRNQVQADTFTDAMNVDELLELKFVQPPAELFELPADAVTCTGRPQRSGICDSGSDGPQVSSPTPAAEPSR